MQVLVVVQKCLCLLLCKLSSHILMVIFGLMSAAKQAFKALMYREWLLMQRNMFVYAFKAIQVRYKYIGLCLVLMPYMLLFMPQVPESNFMALPQSLTLQSCQPACQHCDDWVQQQAVTRTLCQPFCKFCHNKPAMMA